MAEEDGRKSKRLQNTYNTPTRNLNSDGVEDVSLKFAVDYSMKNIKIS